MYLSGKCAIILIYLLRSIIYAIISTERVEEGPGSGHLAGEASEMVMVVVMASEAAGVAKEGLEDLGRVHVIGEGGRRRRVVVVAVEVVEIIALIIP